MIQERTPRAQTGATVVATPAASQKRVRSEPAFLQVSPSQIARVVARSSPHYQEGLWATREHALLAAVVALWFTDLQQLARGQIKLEGALWHSSAVSRMLQWERRGVEAIAAWLGLEPVWIDRMLQSLDLIFPASLQSASGQEAEALTT
ncbi:hypothetical protein ACU4GI_10860 [Cupriavidus basilensis]